MDTNTDSRVAGSLRPAVDEPAATPRPAKRPGSNVLGRMPRRTAPDQEAAFDRLIPATQVAAAPGRRGAAAAVVLPGIVLLAGLAGAWGLWSGTRSLPLTILCGSAGVLGGVFCAILLNCRWRECSRRARSPRRP